MTKFAELNIEVPPSLLIGEKIQMKKLLGNPILVHGFEIRPSKLPKGGNCYYMAITYKEERRIVFVGSVVLHKMLELVPKDKFPFETTVIEDNGRHKFT